MCQDKADTPEREEEEEETLTETKMRQMWFSGQMGRFPPGRAVTGVQLSGVSFTHLQLLFHPKTLKPSALQAPPPLQKSKHVQETIDQILHLIENLKKKNYIIKYFLFIKYIKYFCMVQFEGTLCAVKQTLIKELITFPVG